MDSYALRSRNPVLPRATDSQRDTQTVHQTEGQDTAMVLEPAVLSPLPGTSCCRIWGEPSKIRPTVSSRQLSPVV